MALQRIDGRRPCVARSATRLVVGMLLLLPGCGESGPDTGAIRLSVMTTGHPLDVDPNGYSVTGLGETIALGPSGQAVAPEVASETYSVTLTDVAANCAVAGNATLSVTVAAGETADAEWTVVCGVLPAALDISLATVTGTAMGAALVQVGAADPTLVPAGATTSIEGLLPGPVTVTVKELTPNCRLSSPLVETVVLERAKRSSVELVGSCSEGRLLFEFNGTTWLMDADTTDAAEVVPPAGLTPRETALSPDGSSVAFIIGTSQVWVAGIDGSSPILVASLLNAKLPVWSPDGSRIAFSAGSPDYNDYDVFVVNADGTGLKNVTNDPARDEDPSWAPDGSRLAFHSDREAMGGSIDGYRVFTLGLDGTALTPVSGPGGYSPAWSPDGESIAFIDRGVLTVVNADGTNPVPVADAPLYLQAPRWSPDGRMLLAPDNGSKIYMIDRSGGGSVVAYPGGGLGSVVRQATWVDP